MDFGSLTVQADGSVDGSRIRGVDADLRIKPFFAQGGAFSMRQFIVGALADEMGLQAVDPDLAAAATGRRVVTPSGLVLDGSLDSIHPPPASDPWDDPGGDGVANEIDPAVVDYLKFYLLNYFRPATYLRTAFTELGREAFGSFGCASCHRPSLVVDNDRRVADVGTAYNDEQGRFNRLFATAVPRFTEVVDDPELPPWRRPAGGRFVVEEFYSDLKRHNLGPTFWERNFDGSLQREFVTEPLWGVCSTAPYGHDGRSINLHEVIVRHGGEAESSKRRYASAPASLQLAGAVEPE